MGLYRIIPIQTQYWAEALAIWVYDDGWRAGERGPRSVRFRSGLSEAQLIYIESALCRSEVASYELDPYLYH
jgi:hypothetical protein